ncbi:MAG: dehypoxanthine futalosine cyclase [Acidobacteriaceae bacterium]
MGITQQQALECFASGDLLGIGMEADAFRRSLHPDAVVGYTVICPLDTTSPVELACASVRKSLSIGATGLILQVNVQQQPHLAHYEKVLSGIKQRFPGVWLHGFAATQILTLASSAGIALRDALARLQAAGLDSIDSYAIILDDSIRAHLAPENSSTAAWISVHRTAHQLGLRSSASMVFGVGETPEQRVNHLEILRQLQQDYGGFFSFTPLAYQSRLGIAGISNVPEPTAIDYLTTLAISRLYLENIPHIQGSWPNQGIQMLQVGLRFGSNDVGSVQIDEQSSKPGEAGEEELRRIIRQAGFKPVERDIPYRTLFLHESRS